MIGRVSSPNQTRRRFIVLKTDLSVRTAGWQMVLAGLVVLITALPVLAIPSTTKKPVVRKKAVVSAKSTKAPVKNAVTIQRAAAAATKRRALARTRTGRTGLVAGGPWREPTFADSSNGDLITG